MARKKLSIYSTEERAARKEAKKRKKAAASEFETKRPPKEFEKYEERKRSEARKKVKREKAGEFQSLDHGEKGAACKKYVKADCDRTARLAKGNGKLPHRGEARRSSYKSGTIKKCRDMIAPKGGYVACQKKPDGKGHRLINKTYPGNDDKVTKSRRTKKKVTKSGVSDAKREALLTSLESKASKKAEGPKRKKMITMKLHKHVPKKAHVVKGRKGRKRNRRYLEDS
jgi:hypothetical protein